MMFDRRQSGASNAPSGPAWLVAGAPRPQMQHDGAAELSFAPPCHNAQPHGRAPGSTGPMAEVVDTQQGQDLDQELVRRVQRGDSAAFDLLSSEERRVGNECVSPCRSMWDADH